MKKIVVLFLTVFLVFSLSGCADLPFLGLEGLDKPEELTISMIDDGRVLVSWDECDGAISYDVQYFNASAQKWTDDDDYDSGCMYISSYANDGEYCQCRVRAVRGKNTSDWAEVVFGEITGVESDGDSPVSESASNKHDAQPGEIAAPENLTAEECDANCALISWSESEGDGITYEAQYYSRVNDTWKNDDDYKSGTSYVSTGLDNYDWFQYRVRALKGDSVSDWSSITFYKSTKAPTQPTGMTAQKYNADSVMISWNAVSGATGYEVQYYSRIDSVWKSDPDYVSGTAYRSDGLSNYDWYEYRVRAVNDAGESPWTNYTYTVTYSAPSAPTGLSATFYSRDKAKISWDDVSNISYFEVQYYSRKNSAWKSDSSYPGGFATSYITDGLSEYSSYEFRVRAVRSGGSSAWSYVTYYLPDPPEEPTGLTAVGGANSAYISWDSCYNADSYEVQFYSVKKGTWMTDSDYSRGTSYTSTGLESYPSYDYRVRSVGDGGYSDWSYVTAYLDVEIPSMPTDFYAVSQGYGEAYLSWDSVSGASRYEVQFYSVKKGKWMDDTSYNSGTHYISTGLTSYDSYLFRVRAVNAAGSSEWNEIEYYCDSGLSD